MPESRKSTLPSQVHCVVVKWKGFEVLSMDCVTLSQIVWHCLCHADKVSHCVTLSLCCFIPTSLYHVPLAAWQCPTITYITCYTSHRHRVNVPPAGNPRLALAGSPQRGCCLPSLPRPGTGLVWRLEPEQELRDLGSGEAARARHGRGLVTVTRRPAATRTWPQPQTSNCCNMSSIN